MYYEDGKASGAPGGSAGSGLLSVGPEWQKCRRFIQGDLLHPSAAKGNADKSHFPKPKSWRNIDYFQGLTIQPMVPELSFERRK
jgi:hypothetical protein